MKSGRWQRRAILVLLFVYSIDLVLKLADWRESFGNVPWWGIALGLSMRFAFMSFILFVYLKLRKQPQERPLVTLEMKNAAVKSMRMIQIIFLLAVLGYLYVAEKVFATHQEIHQEVPASLNASFAICAIAMAIIAFSVRRRFLASAINGLRRDPSDSAALVRWRTGTLVSMILALSISMFGLALRLLGGNRTVAWSFFVFSIILMLLWTPRLSDKALAPSASS